MRNTSITACSIVAAIAAATTAGAAPVDLIGTELSLRTQGQATPTSELFVTSFPASATVTADDVEFPDVASLFDPTVGVPPGFARSLVDVAIDVGADFLTIDFDNVVPNRFATGFQNTYVFTFDAETRLAITDAVIDEDVTTLGLTDDRVFFEGNELFVNVNALPFNTSTFARIELTAAVVPLPASALLLVGGLIGLGGLARIRRG